MSERFRTVAGAQHGCDTGVVASEPEPFETPEEGPGVVWRRVGVVVVCATYLWVLFGLGLWVVGPIVATDWEPILIGANSMQPAIRAGDVILIDTNPAGPLAPGDVITYDDPVWANQLVTHRIVDVLEDGGYRTKGDASAVDDSTPIQATTVHGVGRLLVPFVGLPMLWLNKAPTYAALWVLVTVMAWVLAARIGDLTRGGPAVAPARRVPRRTPMSRAGRLWQRVLGPKPLAGPIRRWAPVMLTVLAAVAALPWLGPVAVMWPPMVLLIDPRGPHLPVGRWANVWMTGRFTRRLHPVPMGGTLLTVFMVTVTVVSTATFTAASANPTNSIAAGTLSPASAVTASETCAGPAPTITLNWTASPSTTVEGYVIARNGTTIATVTPRTTVTHTDSTAANTTAYTWTITAYAGSWTATPASVSLTTSCPTGPPTTGPVASNASGQYTFVVPKGTRVGDLLLVFRGSNSAAFTAPAGWTQRLTSSHAPSNVYAGLWSRIATAGDLTATYTFTSNASSAGIGTMIAYVGVDPAAPFDDATTSQHVGTTSLRAKAITTLSNNTTYVAMWYHNVAGSIAPPPGMTTRVLGSAGPRTAFLADGVEAAAGSKPDRIATAVNAGDGLSFMVALNPAGGAFASAEYQRIAPQERVTGSNGRLDRDALVPVSDNHQMQPEAAEAFMTMRSAALEDLGVDLSQRITDSYRSYDQQVIVAALKGLYSQGGLAAEPGTSNHGLGMALDIDVGGSVSGWLRANADRFGFHTIAREPWHWEYRPVS